MLLRGHIRTWYEYRYTSMTEFVPYLVRYLVRVLVLLAYNGTFLERLAACRNAKPAGEMHQQVIMPLQQIIAPFIIQSD